MEMYKLTITPSWMKTKTKRAAVPVWFLFEQKVDALECRRLLAKAERKSRRGVNVTIALSTFTPETQL